MKTCSVCKKAREENEFFFRNKDVGKLHSQCKECYKARRQKQWKDYYYQHGSKYREKAVARNRKIKDGLRRQILEYLSDKACVECGITGRRVLEFDHIDPSTKSCGIAGSITSLTSWGRILAEISKCQILCANCHKIKTSKERGWYRNL